MAVGTSVDVEAMLEPVNMLSSHFLLAHFPFDLHTILSSGLGVLPFQILDMLIDCY